LKDMLKGVAPSVALGRDTTMLREIVDKTAERIGAELKQQPEVGAELSWVVGNTYEALGNYGDAERMYRTALEVNRQRPGGDNIAVAYLLGHIAGVVGNQGRNAEAETLEREALALWKKLGGEESPHVADTLDRLAMVYLRQSQNAPGPASQKLLMEAEALEHEALRLRRKSIDNEGFNTARSLGNLALVLGAQRRQSKAEPIIRETLAIHRKLLGNENLTVAMWLINLGDCLMWQGKHDEADRLFREGLAIRRRLSGNEHPDVAYSLSHLAKMLQRQGKPAETEKLEREALAIYRKLPAHPHMIVTLRQLTAALRDQDKLAESESLLRESLSILEQKTPDAWDTFDASSMLGGSLLGQKKYTEAEPLLLSGYEGMKQREALIPVADGIRRKDAILRRKEAALRFVQLYQATGQSEKAAEWKKALTEFDNTEAEKKSVAPKPEIETPENLK
jgi:eukaryotic-like serine/threonine-protein kinase